MLVRRLERQHPSFAPEQRGAIFEGELEANDHPARPAWGSDERDGRPSKGVAFLVEKRVLALVRAEAADSHRGTELVCHGDSVAVILAWRASSFSRW